MAGARLSFFQTDEWINQWINEFPLYLSPIYIWHFPNSNSSPKDKPSSNLKDYIIISFSNLQKQNFKNILNSNITTGSSTCLSKGTAQKVTASTSKYIKFPDCLLKQRFIW